MKNTSRLPPIYHYCMPRIQHTGIALMFFIGVLAFLIGSHNVYSTHVQKATTSSLPLLSSLLSVVDTPLHNRIYDETIGETATLSVSIPIGTHVSTLLTLTNHTTHTITPLLYEAWSRPAPGVPLHPITGGRAVPSGVRVVVQHERVDPRLRAALAAADGGATTFLVVLDDQADVSAAYGISDWGERGEYVYTTLTHHADTTQRGVRALLDARHTPYQSLWMVNGLMVHGTSDDVAALAQRSEVALVAANDTMTIDAPHTAPPRTWFLANGHALLAAATRCLAAAADGVCWNIAHTGARRVWDDFGVSGQGITVAHIDSGVWLEHSALTHQYRGYNNGSFTHTYNWYDPVKGSEVPTDAGVHGSHTMGIMVGRGDGTSTHPAIGMAPGAQWIAARGCGSSACTESNLLLAAQWLLAPTDANGHNARPDLRPHIINNSWASSIGGDTHYIDFTVAWRAAGIFPVFAAGNNTGTTTCGSVVSPGDYAHVVGVGAVDNNGNIASFSRLGPARDGSMKPDIVAPGDNIVSSFSSTNAPYGMLNGTSMASPHVAGAVALLWSANPSLIGNYDATYARLTSTAHPTTDAKFSLETYPTCAASTSPNNVYGYGQLDIYRAVAAARVDVPWLDIPHRVEAVAPNETRAIPVVIDAHKVTHPGTYTARMLLSAGNLSEPMNIYTITLHIQPSNDVAWLSGIVTSNDTSTPLKSTIAIEPGPHVAVDDTGTFSVTLRATDTPISYTITVSATGYVRQTHSITLTRGMHYTLPLSLAVQKPRIKVRQVPITRTLDYGTSITITERIDNVGTLPLDYTVTVPQERFGVWRSDEAASAVSPQWIDSATRGIAVTLGDDTRTEAIKIGFPFPLYDTTYTHLYIYANGVIVFGTPKDTQYFTPSCGARDETDGVALAPFLADLDPTQQGTVSYALVPEDHVFVVTYDNIRYHNQQAAVTFQVVLHADGTIHYNYRTVAALPPLLFVGMQYNASDVQTIGCNHDVVLHDALTIELRPQIASHHWLALTDGTDAALSATLAAGEQASIGVHMMWANNNYPQPYRSAVVITSNDPYSASIRLPIELTSRPFYRTITLTNTPQMVRFTNTRNQRVTMLLPATTVSDTITIQYTEDMTPTMTNDTTVFAAQAFRIDAYQHGAHLAALPTTATFTITLGYDDSDMSVYDEQTVTMMWRNSQDDEWQPLPSLSLSSYHYDSTTNEVSSGITTVGHYMVVYHPVRFLLFLPIVVHRQS